MGFLESLKNFFAAPSDSGSRFIVFKVRCDRCGEEITVKASRTSDVSRIYEDESHGGAEFFLRKEILGNKCNKLIYADIYFGPGFNIISKEITGGKFID